MKLLYLLLPLLSLPLAAQSSFSIAAANKTVVFREIDELTVVGVGGNDLTVEGDSDPGRDARAQGLRRISGSGLTDNTGVGLSITEDGGRILVQQVGGGETAVTVRVPNSASVEVEQTTERGGDLTVREFSGPLDVSMMYHGAHLDNVTGPAAVNVVYDDVTARYDRAPTAETRLHSSYSNVDVTLPAATRADLRLSTSYGSMYTDFDLQVNANLDEADDRPAGRGSETLNGTVGGGGVLLALTATYGNLYLRKK